MDGGESPSTPATSVAHSLAGGLPSPLREGPDPKAAAQLQQQAKQLDEQEAMIKTLNKQLTHCEGDLQAHMDMVATLETSLADAEKNCKSPFLFCVSVEDVVLTRCGAVQCGGVPSKFPNPEDFISITIISRLLEWLTLCERRAWSRVEPSRLHVLHVYVSVYQTACAVGLVTVGQTYITF